MTLAPPGLGLQRACELLSISRSGYYRARQGPSAATRTAAAETTRLRDRIEALCLEFSGYGYRRGTAQLHREGIGVNHKRVLRLMREESLLCHVKRHFVTTTDSQHGFRRYPNLIAGLTPTDVNEIWIADVT